MKYSNSRYEIIFGDIIRSTEQIIKESRNCLTLSHIGPDDKQSDICKTLPAPLSKKEKKSEDEYLKMINDFINMIHGLSNDIKKYSFVKNDDLAGIFPCGGDSFVALIPVKEGNDKFDCSKTLVIEIILYSIIEWVKRNYKDSHIAIGVHTSENKFLFNMNWDKVSPKFNYCASVDFVIAKRLETIARKPMMKILCSDSFYKSLFSHHIFQSTSNISNGVHTIMTFDSQCEFHDIEMLKNKFYSDKKTLKEIDSLKLLGQNTTFWELFSIYDFKIHEKISPLTGYGKIE